MRLNAFLQDGGAKKEKNGVNVNDKWATKAGHHTKLYKIKTTRAVVGKTQVAITDRHPFHKKKKREIYNGICIQMF